MHRTGPKVCIVGYPLAATLSGHGAVSRGICVLEDNGDLASLSERKGVQKKDDGTIIVYKPAAQ